MILEQQNNSKYKKIVLSEIKIKFLLIMIEEWVIDGDYFFSKFIRMCNQPEGFYKVLIRKGFNYK